MNLLLFVTLSVTFCCAAGLLSSMVLAYNGRTRTRRVQTVLKGATKGAAPPPPRQSSLSKNIIRASHWMSARLGMANDPALIERFDRAGLNTTSSRDVYLAARMLGPIFGVVAGTLSPFNHLMSMLVLASIAYLLPDLILGRTIKARREKIRLGLPDAIDLLVICVDAGLGMDQALLRVAQELSKSHPALQEEFLRINREQRAGKIRLEAWSAMAKRIQVPEVDAFVNMLAQTERFGTPIARALSNFGDTIRMKRRQHAEELAAKTTVKIIFPLVICIFPSLFIVLLGPALITISHGFGDLPK